MLDGAVPVWIALMAKVKILGQGCSLVSNPIIIRAIAKRDEPMIALLIETQRLCCPIIRVHTHNRRRNLEKSEFELAVDNLKVTLFYCTFNY